MTASLARTISVYQCDVCKRRHRTPSNRQGVDIIQRCIVTEGCKGKMHRVISQLEVNKTPVFAPGVTGLTDWSQRSVLYTHYQPITATTWVIEHKLGNKPNLYVYVMRAENGNDSKLVKTTDFTSNVVNDTTTIITFPNIEQGLVQCVSSMSKNLTNPDSSLSAVVDTDIIQLTHNGELTIATATSAAKVSFNLTYMSPAVPDPIYIEYINLGEPSLYSPWAASNSENVVVNGKEYKVRSLNLATTQLAPTYFSSGLITSGSTVTVTSDLPPRTVLILLSHPPHAAADRIYDQYIDAANLTAHPPHLFYNDQELYADYSVLKNTYPPIIVV